MVQGRGGRRKTPGTNAKVHKTLCLVLVSSGLYSLNKYQNPERGARMARRDDRAYREYVREEQRRQPGCPAPEAGS